MLDKRTAFVTGGTGVVGAAIVRCLAEQGARVAFSFQKQEAKARQIEAELAAKIWVLMGICVSTSTSTTHR